MTGMTARTDRLPQRLVMIGETAYEKPFDATCGACRSPYAPDIDQALAEGYSYKMVRSLFAGRRPKCPNDVILRAHVAYGHLAAPHLKARLAVEASVAERGGDSSTTSAGYEEALAAIIQHGTGLLASGMLEVRASDMVAAARLQAQLERARDGEGVEASVWQGAFMTFFEIVRKHLSPNQWKAFVAEVYASPEVRAVMSDSQRAVAPGEVER
jgi:hypothetical protein